MEKKKAKTKHKKPGGTCLQLWEPIYITHKEIIDHMLYVTFITVNHIKYSDVMYINIKCILKYYIKFSNHCLCDIF